MALDPPAAVPQQARHPRRGAVPNARPGVTLTATMGVKRLPRLSSEALSFQLQFGRVMDGHRELQNGREVRSYIYDHTDHRSMIRSRCEERPCLGPRSVNRGKGMGNVSLHGSKIRVGGHVQALKHIYNLYWPPW